MSFVNLMGNDIWSEADIKSRLHAEVRSEISELMETEINRALQGAALGMHKLTPQEMQAVQQFKASTDRVAALGEKARADMTLLSEVLPLEKAFLRLRQPVLEAVFETEEVLVDGELQTVPTADAKVMNQEALDRDTEERLIAETLLGTGSEKAMNLVRLRNPEPPVIETQEGPQNA